LRQTDLDQCAGKAEAVQQPEAECDDPRPARGETRRAAIQARDQSDKTRAASPLTLAPDAVHIDTTEMPIDEVVQRVLDLARERSA